MRVPMTIADFLDRAELVFAAGVGVIDEPDQPARARSARRTARWRGASGRWQAGLDELGVRRGRAGGGRVSHNSARLLELLFGGAGVADGCCVPVNFRLSGRGGRVHRRALAAPRCCWSTPSSTDAARPTSTAEHRFVLGERDDAELMRSTPSREPWSVPDEDATATINYTSGTTARPKGVQLTHRNLWLNAVELRAGTPGVSDRDVYLHTLPMFHCNGWGMPFAVAGHGRARTWCCARSTARRSCAASSEHGVTLMCGAPAVVERGARRARRSWDGRGPGRGTGADRRGRRPAAHPDDRAGRGPSSAGSSSRSTASPRPRRCSPSTGRAPSGTA